MQLLTKKIRQNLCRNLRRRDERNEEGKWGVATNCIGVREGHGPILKHSTSR